MKQTLLMILIWAGHAMAPCLAEPTLPEGGGKVEPPANLPKVLLIGDSISGGYSKAVKRILDGRAAVTGPIANAEATIFGVAHVDDWLGDTKWDLIHFNWGLWDIYGWKYAKEDRSPAMYEKRLETLVTRLKKTGAKLIWATTTPVCPGAEKTMLNQFKTEVIISPETELLYRDTALRVMKKNGIEVDDLYAAMKPHRAKHQADDNVHFSGAGYGLLAKQVADCISAALEDEDSARDGADAGKAPGRFIDGHVHFHDRAPGDLDRVIEWMETMDIQRCINHPLRQSRFRNEQERGQMLANYAKHKGRIDRFCIIYPEEIETVEQAVAILTREKQEGAIGFGEHYGEKLMFDDPKNMRLYAACEKVGLPVMFHMDRNKNMDEKGLPRLENVLKTYPDCILIAHSDWWRHVPEGACDRLLKKYPNLYADISCTVKRSRIGSDKKMAREFFIRHADKLMFGTDSGWWSLGGNKDPMPEFSLIGELKLPKEVEDKICRKNAERLFSFESRQSR